MITKASPSATFRIWIGGQYGAALAACRSFTMRGLCVAVQPVDYVYTMGMEAGVCVTLISYPRFPLDAGEIEKTATELGHFLCEWLCQGSFTVEGPEKTVWFSRREQDAPQPKQEGFDL